MDILYLLIPFSVLLVLVILGIFGWALNNGQLDDLEREGDRILGAEEEPFDTSQPFESSATEQSRAVNRG